MSRNIRETEFAERIQVPDMTGLDYLGEKDKNEKTVQRRIKELSADRMKLNAFILAGIAFSINDMCKGTVVFDITSRVKSIESSLKKHQRMSQQVKSGTRKSADILDLIANKLTIERVEEKGALLSTFSAEVGKRYYERARNIDLLASIVNFIDEQLEIGGFQTEYDSYEDTQENNANEIMARALETQNNSFKSNIIKYRPGVKIGSIQRPDLETELIGILNEERRKNTIPEIDEEYKNAITLLSAERISKPKEKNDQKEYYKYIIILLNRLLNLEYKECTISYEKIQSTLKNSISSFLKLSESEQNLSGQGFTGNVLLEDLVNLVTWSKEFNTQLSDRLQRQIIEEIMEIATSLEYPNLSIFMKENDDHTLFIERHQKPNGYVADHYIQICQTNGLVIQQSEFQAMTRYREKVASIGKAAYGNGRQDKKIGEEKKRPLYLLPNKRSRESKKYTDEKDNLTLLCIMGKTVKIDKMTEQDIVNWQKELQRITPRYFTTVYNTKTDSVEITYHSTYENVSKYFLETNSRKQRKIIKEGLAIIKERNLLPDNSITITFPRKEYIVFMQSHQFQELLNSIEGQFDVKDSKNSPDVPEGH